MASGHPRYLQRLNDRTLVSLSGERTEQEEFLQSLVTNDVTRAGPDWMVYAALLTPQGKYLSDFLIWRSAEGDFRLDVASMLAPDLVKRLGMYRLRRAIAIDHAPVEVLAVWGVDPGEGLRDPRDPLLGWRVYDDAPIDGKPGDYALHRLSLGVPESGADLVANDTYVLEAGFERLDGVDFRKGCYVGQEVVARMKHKTDLRKGLLPVMVTGSAPSGTALLTEDGKPAGTLYSNRDGIGLAQLRHDRTEGVLRDEQMTVRVVRR